MLYALNQELFALMFACHALKKRHFFKRIRSGTKET